MIYDSIQNMIDHLPAVLPRAAELTAFLKAAREHTFEELQQMDFAPLDVRYDQYTSKTESKDLLEAHRKYWDLQIVMEGMELVGYAPLETLEEKIPYDETEDIAFYAGPYQTLRLGGGMAMLLAPWDAHLPQLAGGASRKIKKIVVKLPW